MRPLRKPPPPYDPPRVTRGGAPRLPYDVVRTALRDTVGFYCAFCEMPAYEAEVITRHHKKARCTPALSQWDDLLPVCDHCRFHRAEDAPDPSLYLWPDVDVTFSFDGPFVYTMREVRFAIADAETGEVSELRVAVPIVSAAGPDAERARRTIDLFRLNTPFYDPAANTFSGTRTDLLLDRRLELRAAAWETVLGCADRLRQAREIGEKNYELLVKSTASVAQSVGFWSVWMTVLWQEFHDRELLQRVLLQVHDRRGYIFIGYQTVPNGGRPPWSVFPGTAIERISL